MNIVWFARTKDILRTGPYATQEEATKATFVTRHTDTCRAGHLPYAGKCDDGCLEVPAEGAFVWPEKRINKYRTQR